MTGTMLRNDEITRVDNAGVAIRTLAPTDKVVWFQPTSVDDAYGGDDTTDDIPDAIAPLVLLAGFGLLAAMLWRGRRFGALVTEPLPVVVKSDETTRSRGRLYHRSRAIDRSAAALRAHALQKISVTVGLPYDPRSGRSRRRPRRRRRCRLRMGSGPDLSAAGRSAAAVDDDGLVLFARALSDLEKEVRFTPASATHHPGEQTARAALGAVRNEVAKAVVGQDAAVAGILIALLCRGHILLEGVPGVAKTLLVRTLANTLAVDTKRVQFTPDLMPGDITGSLVFDSATSEFTFREGPVFTNLMLADEMKRTPPKTQAALLEAMERWQVTIDGKPAISLCAF